MTNNNIALSVTQLNTYVKMLFEGDLKLRNVIVRGEVSNFSGKYRSGHLYFSLKDETGSVKAVMFSSNARYLNFELENGMMVYVTGRVSVYERDGIYQIYVEKIEPVGIGSMMLAFEQLRQRLEKEGIFAEEKKRPLPKFPKKIGIATAKLGAAIHDVESVLSRRFPLVKCELYSCAVQGKQCPADNAAAIDYFNSKGDIDLILICRGGGSKEDLWYYNDETLVRKIAGSRVPVLTGIGHDIDLSLSDLAADKYAPTPSAAAEIAVPNADDLRQYVDSLEDRCFAAVYSKISALNSNLENLSVRVNACSPSNTLLHRRQTTDNLLARIDTAMTRKIDGCDRKLGDCLTRLSVLDPKKIFERGKISLGSSVLKSVEDVKIGDIISISLPDGTVEARAEKITKIKR